MACSVVLGIDPGAHGAVAILSSTGELLAVEDMPNTPEASGRVATNAALLAGIIANPLRTHNDHAQVERIFCEFVGARPTDGSIQAFAFGRARGVIEGIAGAFDIPIVFVTPPTWKRLAGVPAGKEHKDVARTRAIARWPAHAQLFARKCDVDRAEAGLIGVAGLERIEMGGRRGDGHVRSS
jgi:crossover junction endodeoxyribonuclease RuvC